MPASYYSNFVAIAPQIPGPMLGGLECVLLADPIQVTCMRHVTRQNKSRHTYKPVCLESPKVCSESPLCVMDKSHVDLINESCHTYKYVCLESPKVCSESPVCVIDRSHTHKDTHFGRP